MSKFLLGLTWGLMIGAVGGLFAIAVVEAEYPERFIQVLQKYKNSNNKEEEENSVEIGAEE